MDINFKKMGIGVYNYKSKFTSIMYYKRFIKGVLCN